MSSSLLGLHASRDFERSRPSYQPDPHDPCDFWLSGFLSKPDIGGIFAGFLPSKRGTRNWATKRKMKPKPWHAWNHRSNGDAPQPLPPLLPFRKREKLITRIQQIQRQCAL